MISFEGTAWVLAGKRAGKTYVGVPVCGKGVVKGAVRTEGRVTKRRTAEKKREAEGTPKLNVSS